MSCHTARSCGWPHPCQPGTPHTPGSLSRQVTTRTVVPGELSGAGFPEAGEFADLVHQHLACFAAQLAPPRQEPVNQFLAGIGDRTRHAVGQDRVLLPYQRDSSMSQVEKLIDALVPSAGGVTPMHLLTLTPSDSPSVPVTVNINQQVVNSVEGIVVQNIQGTTNISPEAKELLNLVKRFGAQDMVALESAVHELEDPDGERVIALAQDSA